jgi:glycosyltransferase involved in cell wall biosynthesis
MFSDGGAEKTNLLISEELSKKYKIFFVSNFFSTKFDKDIKRIGIKKIKLNSPRTITSFFEIIKVIKNLKPELIIPVQTHANVLIILINLIFFKKTLKVVGCERLSPQSYNKNLKGKLILFLAKILYRYADKIICNSRGLSNEIRKITNSKNITFIYNPTLKNNFKQLANKFNVNERPFSSNKKKKIIISIGRLDEIKNQMMLLRAINNLEKKNNLEVVFIGEGKNKEELINYSKKINFRNNLHILGFKKNPYPYLLKSNLLVHTSNFEGLPNVLIEAMSLGVPIISTNSPSGPKEILLNGKAGFLIERNDHESLSKKISLFLRKPDIFLKKKSLYKQSLKRFLPKKNLKKYMNIIKNLV